MNNRMVRSMICIALVLLVSLTSSAALFANAAELYPTVFVEGIVSKETVRFNEDGTTTAIFPPSEETLKNAVKVMSGDLLKSIACGKLTKDSFGDALVDTLKVAFADMECDEAGNPKENTGIDFDYSVTHYDEKMGYVFKYDWRLSPFTIAEYLDRYIDLVKQETGSTKVNLHGYSMGGAMTMTYLYQYGCEKIGGIVMQSSAFLGTRIAGECFNKDLTVGREQWVRYVDNWLLPGETEKIINTVMQLLERTYLLDGISNFASKFLDTYIDRVYEEVLEPVYIHSLGMWTLVPGAYYEKAKALFLSDTDKYADFIQITDAYQYNIQRHVKDILDSAMEQGVKIGIISKYNMQLTPLGASQANHGDLVIDSDLTSAGATFAPIGKTLGNDYVQHSHTDQNYLSADGVIDASTCMYPAYTWFIKDMQHANYWHDDLLNLIDYILNSSEQVTVFDDETYPQYLLYDELQDSIRPLTQEDSALYRIPGLIEICFHIFKYIYEAIYTLIHV